MKQLLLFLALTVAAAAKPIAQYPGAQNNLTPGVGFAFSGAGARVAQQVALAQALLNGNYPGGTKIAPQYLSGVSSGSLSMVALNGVLEYAASNGTAGWSQDAWTQFTLGLTDAKVFKTGVRGVFSSIGNLNDGYILDNSPLIDTLNQALSQLGYSRFGDLFLPSYISVVDQVSGVNVRLLSTDPVARDLPLIQILLASTAIPVAFQPRTIPALTNSTVFIDGGTGLDYLPVLPLIDGSLPVTTIYGLIPNQDQGTNSNSDNDDLEKNGIIRNALRSYEIQGKNLLAGALAVLANSNVTGYLYSAVLNRTFSTLNFGTEQQQYTLAQNWARSNNPTPISAAGLTAYNSVVPALYESDGSQYSVVNSQLYGDAPSSHLALPLLAFCALVALMV